LLPNFLSLLKQPIQLLALGFGSGLAPKAPGTFGTLAAIPFFLWLSSLSIENYILMLVITFSVGIVLCQRTADDLGVHDHPAIVWDEFVGVWIALIPLLIFEVSGVEFWLYLLLGFVLFRFFDIIKPWPIGWLDQKVHGGLGIMLDDVLAGIEAALCLYLLILFMR